MYSFRKNSNDEVVVKFCLYSCPQVIPRGLFLKTELSIVFSAPQKWDSEFPGGQF